MPDGSTQPVDELHIRATEYTVGDSGPDAMPAPLPPSVAYTYCVDLTADEAVSAGADQITFDKPLPYYVENFLRLPRRDAVPVGFYDEQKHAWVGAGQRRRHDILSIADGKAVLDVSTMPERPPALRTLAAFGITDEELTKLATLYRTRPEPLALPAHALQRRRPQLARFLATSGIRPRVAAAFDAGPGQLFRRAGPSSTSSAKAWASVRRSSARPSSSATRATAWTVTAPATRSPSRSAERRNSANGVMVRLEVAGQDDGADGLDSLGSHTGCRSG